VRRDRRQAFRVRYALLENRPVHVTHLAADAATVERLRDAFARRLFVEDDERRRQAGLDADVALFDLAAHAAADAAWQVRGAGYFLADGFIDGGAGAGASAALAELRARVWARHGDDAIGRRLAALRATLAALPLQAAAAVDAPAGRFAVAPPTAATRLGELLEQVTALEVLAAAPALRADALVAAPAPLTEAERGALRRWAARATAALADLPGSTRPDWGWAMLLGMTRLAAVEASLAAGRLLVLDAWPADARRPPLPDGAQREAFFAALAAHGGLLVERSRRDCLGADDCAEAGYARLESAVNRAADVTAARGASRPPRVAPDPLLPARPAAAAARHRVAAWLGELNAATAAGYRRGPDDSTFVFFTDDTLAARPLLGAVNLAAAGAEGALGLLTWPADGGRRLQGGALYSLPELTFVNIRKGTTAWLMPEELPAAEDP
jgi:hypothetical protein